MYSELFVFVKKDNGWGHVFVAFGNNDYPQIVFNQSGADGSNSAWGDSARFSRVSFRDAANNFIVGKDKYFVFKIANGGAMKAFNYATNLFEKSPPYKNAKGKEEDRNRHRNRSYNALTGNCATLSAEIIREAGVWEMNNVNAPMDVWWIMGQLDVT